MKRNNLWPIVVITAVVIAALVVIIAVTPTTDVATRSTVLALLASVVPTIVGVWVKSSVDEVREDVSKVKGTVGELQTQTNGHMTALIAAKTIPDSATVVDGSGVAPGVQAP